MRVSITKKIFFNFLILSIVPIIIIDTYFYFKSKNALINRTFDQLTTIRIEKSNRIKDFFMHRYNYINTLSRYHKTDSILKYLNNNKLDFNSELIIDLKNNIKENIGKKSSYNKIFFISKNNNILFIDINNNFNFDSLQKESLNYKYIKNVINSSIKYCKPFIYDKKSKYLTSNKSIFIIKKLYHENNYKGSIITEISLNAINKIMYENNPHNGLGKTGETYLVGSDYFMRSSSRFKNNSIYNIKVNTQGVKEALNYKTETKQIFDYRKISVLSSYSRVGFKGLDWVILAEIDTKEAMIPIYLIRNDILFMSLVLSILMLGLVVILSTKITAPIQKLKQATDKIIIGEKGKFVNIKSNDEIGDLIIAFNKMLIQLEEQTKKLEQERKLQTKSLFEGQEIERQRLSRELHDSLGQLILALKLKFEQIKNITDTKTIKQIDALFIKIMNEIRSISNNLMPAVLTELGLLTAIKKLIREFYTNTKINVNFTQNIENKNINKKIEVHIYRIIQETFSNILKHSKANNVNLIINCKNEIINLIIEDNGKGFLLSQETVLKGNGLSNIKERINIINGYVNIKSELNKGTKIYCKIPLKQLNNGKN